MTHIKTVGPTLNRRTLLLLTSVSAGAGIATITGLPTEAAPVVLTAMHSEVDGATSPAASPVTLSSPAATGSPEASAAGSPTPEPSTEPRVRFTAGDAEIIVRITDNPTSRDLLSMLPLTLEFEDFNSMEKISYLPRELTTEGPTGRAPANGDLIYFIPWGNLGFFYNAERRDASYDDQVIPIGTIETGYELLNELETGPVSVELIP